MTATPCAPALCEPMDDTHLDFRRDVDSAVLANNICRVMQATDSARLFLDADLQRLARGVASASTRQTVSYPGPVCPDCGRPRRLFRQKAAKAMVLDTDGLRQLTHVPSRCQAAACPARGRLLWGNFHCGPGGARLWRSPAKSLPQFFMVTPRFGVTLAWYRQFSRRLIFHQASFEGEANVHKSPLLSVGRLSKNLLKAWLAMRVLERMWERGAQDSQLRLDEPAETTLGAQFTAYYAGMRRLRARQCAAGKVDTTLQVMDGHAKLTRRTCCVAQCCAVPSAKLGAFCVTACPGTPQVLTRQPKRKQESELHDAVRLKRRILCHDHQRVFEATQGNLLHRLQWIAPVGKSASDLAVPWVASSTADGSARRVPLDSLPRGALLEHLVHSSVQNFDPPQDASVPLEPPLTDEATLAELAELNCKTSKMTHVTAARAKPKRKNARSGGFLVACADNGYITDAFEFMGAESLSQRYIFLAKLREVFPDLKVIVHDDACHLRRFADKWAP